MHSYEPNAQLYKEKTDAVIAKNDVEVSDSLRSSPSSIIKAVTAAKEIIEECKFIKGEGSIVYGGTSTSLHKKDTTPNYPIQINKHVKKRQNGEKDFFASFHTSDKRYNIAPKHSS